MTLNSISIVRLTCTCGSRETASCDGGGVMSSLQLLSLMELGLELNVQEVRTLRSKIHHLTNRYIVLFHSYMGKTLPARLAGTKWRTNALIYFFAFLGRCPLEED